VGSLYKVPTYPIWVIGSATHFTVLFSMDRRVNEESSEEQLLARVQRVFKAVDSDGCGFVMDTQLAGILEQLEVPFASDPTDVLRFSSLVQLEGGIVLWSTFWEKVSLLLTGTSLDELVEGPIVNTRVRS
ncbi:mindy3, partial [Symbiodinium microadriaticum]